VGLIERRQKSRSIYGQRETAVSEPVGRLVDADRITHLRIVVVALVAAILVAAVGTFAARNENEKAANLHGGEMAVKQHRL
jgi:ABC-type proline/glycine betaine transport system permease subunit